MKNSKLTILTPYYPTQNNPYGGIFVYDQAKVIAKHVEHVDIYVTRPWFKLSRKFPFIASSRDELTLKKNSLSNVRLNLIRYFPFPKDSIFYHLSLFVSVFFHKHKFSCNLLVHTIYPLGSAVKLLKLLPTIVIHGSDFRYFSKNKKQLKTIAAVINDSRIVCVSEGLMKEVEDTDGVIVNRTNLSVVENGVLIPNMKVPLQRTPKDKGIFDFVFVGSLIKLKGVHELLEAFSKLQDKSGHQEYSLTFIGEGIEKNCLEENVNKNGIKNVSFLGALENKKVMLTLAEKDCLILPSYQEGFGRVIIEMLSLGKPVIATKSGGPEFILNNKTGMIVPPKDSGALVSAMEKVSNNYELYISSVLKDYVNRNYCLEKQTLELLRSIFME